MAKPSKNPFLELLAGGPVVADGAMGTQLYERGVFLNRNLEAICLQKPALVQRVHEEYIDAGAQLIQTHTFGANRIKLTQHGLGDQVEEINRRAVEIAIEASAGRVSVGGSIGPTGTVPGVMTDSELEEVRNAFREQVTLLADSGVSVICFETFRQLSELRLAVAAAQDVCDLPVVAQVAFDAEIRTADGADPIRVVEVLKQSNVAMVGTNCIEGPEGVFRAVEQMVGRGIPVAARPNAGYPRLEDDRLIYMATPEYFGVYARRYFKLGVRMVGGCCGTSPEHTKRIASSARMMGGGKVPTTPHISVASHQNMHAGLVPCATEEKTDLAAKIMKVYRERVRAKNPAPMGPEHFVVSVEVNPPSGLDPTKAIEAAKMLRDGGVDVINIADGPRATVRMSNQALALLIRRELGMETILHVCCRDRNLLGLQSDLLANHVLGLHNLVIITGDPPKLGDYPHATAVFDVDSIGLLRLVNGLNRGVDPAGKVVGETTRFLTATGAEPAALDYDRELRRLELKIQAGAEFVMTQPVYDPAILERFLDDVDTFDVPVLVGLLPLASYRNAEFLHNEVPGMRIPDHIRGRMQQYTKGSEARAEGVRIAQESLEAVSHRVVGAYIMPPFGRYGAALEILRAVCYKNDSVE
jgi:methionine synthase I (cobalamin-dependent)/5,10-methylenetetrahydrofolate reductase